MKIMCCFLFYFHSIFRILKILFIDQKQVEKNIYLVKYVPPKNIFFFI